MKKSKFYLLGVVMGAALIAAGCATQRKGPLPDFTPQGIPMGTVQKKVDNFMVILDSSSSLDENYQNSTEFDWAKGIVTRMNATLPKEIDLKCSLTTYGHATDLSHKPVLTQYDFGKYDQKKFQEAVDKVAAPGGTSPMNLAISELKAVDGKTALIVVSDGDVVQEETLAALKKLADQFGERLCVYTVQVGDSPAGKKVLEQMAKNGKCGQLFQAKDIASGAGMNGFVKTVFFEELTIKDSDGDGVTDDKDQCPGTPRGVKVDAVGCPLDSDGDGVTDDKDQCPGTPRGVKVDAVGCPLDSDGDGVTDDKDKCPGTPKGVIVDADGCPIAKMTQKGTYIFEGIQFDTAKWSFKPQSYAVMDKIVKTMETHPNLKVEIQGHTDNKGSAPYNQALSDKRAKAVMEYIVSKGIAAERLTAKGYGLSMPLESNDTEAGRAANRRVELKPIQ